jgi:hypothetical protein
MVRSESEGKDVPLASAQAGGYDEGVQVPNRTAPAQAGLFVFKDQL